MSSHSVRYLIGIAGCLLLMLASSCSVTRYVPDGSRLLDRVTIASETDSIALPEDIRDYTLQQPNYRLFGMTRWLLRVYSSSNPNSKSWWNRSLRKMGEPPVLIDSVLTERTANRLAKAMAGDGFLDATARAVVDTGLYKKARITYLIQPGSRYYIRNMALDVKNPLLPPVTLGNSLLSAYKVGISEGSPLSPIVLDEERKAIARHMRNNGFWKFSAEDVYYEADTTVSGGSGTKSADLKLVVNGIGRYPYRIGRVFFHADYDPLESDFRVQELPRIDSISRGDYTVYYGSRGRYIRASALTRSVSVTPGALFCEDDVERSYIKLNALPIVRNVNIRFVEHNGKDEIAPADSSRLVDCYILTVPAKSKSFEAEVLGTNSAGDFGAALSLGFTDRNLFRGAEMFNIKLKGAYEAIRKGSHSFMEYGVESSLRFPRLLFPFISDETRRRLRASTEWKIGYNYQTRPEFDRVILSAQLNYSWQTYLHNRLRHTIRLLDVDYLHLPYIDPDFAQSLPPTTALYNYTEQFILGSAYILNYTTASSMERIVSNPFTARFSIQTAGNLLQAISYLTDSPKDEHGLYKMFGLHYAQFVKLDLDLAKTVLLEKDNTLALHLGFGLAFPYGNARHIPFELRYFAGGSNSVRGWSVRTLGPGSMKMTPDKTFFDQMGDIRLDLNVEYRTKLFWKFRAAAFVDAGNVWTIKEYENQEDGLFRFDRFYKEIALAYGLGLRLDFDYFLVRLDAGLKAYDPQQTGRYKWAITRPNLSSNFAWHIAVGYPF